MFSNNKKAMAINRYLFSRKYIQYKREALPQPSMLNAPVFLELRCRYRAYTVVVPWFFGPKASFSSCLWTLRGSCKIGGSLVCQYVSEVQGPMSYITFAYLTVAIPFPCHHCCAIRHLFNWCTRPKMSWDVNALHSEDVLANRRFLENKASLGDQLPCYRHLNKRSSWAK